MSSRGRRRSISVKGITYQRLKDHCDATGRTMSGWLEDTLADELDARGVPVPDSVTPVRKKNPGTKRHGGVHFW